MKAGFCRLVRFHPAGIIVFRKTTLKIVAYVDESGRHDPTGKQAGAEQIVVGGWVDWADNWVNFSKQWQSVLERFGATHFHFKDWAGASAVARKTRRPNSSNSNNPYIGWDNEKLDAFLYELAALAGGGQKIVVGGFTSTRDFAAAKQHPAYSHTAPALDPYQACLTRFFKTFSTEVQQQWPYWKEPVTFFFDQNGDTQWCHAVQNAFAASNKEDPRIAELIFVNSRDKPHLPVQAADMLCYRLRQIVEKFVDPEILPNPSKLDDLLIKPTFLRATPEYLKGALEGWPFLLHLRYGDYPWRK